MCHTSHRAEEKKVVIRYLLQTSFPLSRGETLHNFIVFDINLCRSIPPQPDKQIPTPLSACQIIQVCTEGEERT